MYNIFMADTLISDQSAHLERIHVLRGIERFDDAPTRGRRSRRETAATFFRKKHQGK